MAKHISIDIQAWQASTARLSYEQKGIYWEILTMLYERDGYIPVADLPILLNLEPDVCVRIANVIKTHCGIYTITYNDIECYTHDKVLSVLSGIQEKSEKARKSAERRWNKQKNKYSEPDLNDNADAMRTHSECNTKIKDYKIKDYKIKKTSKKENKIVIYADLMRYWNDNAPRAFPKIDVISEKRKRLINGRLADRTVDDIKLAMRKVFASTFCCGKNNRGWVAGFDFVISGKIDEILACKYDNNKQTNNADNNSIAEDLYMQQITKGK